MCTTLLTVSCHSEWHVECLPFWSLFSCGFFYLYFQDLCQLFRLSQLPQSLVHLQLLLLDVVIIMDATPSHWTFYFQGYSYPLADTGQVCQVCKVCIVLQELQLAVLILHGMDFCLSDKMIALHLNNSNAIAYWCNKGGTVSFFLSRLACHILNLDEKHGITIISAYIYTSLNVVTDYLLQRRFVLEWHLFSYISSRGILGLGSTRVGFIGILMDQTISVLYTLKIHYLLEPWVWMFSAILGYIRWVMCFLLLHEFP